MAVKNHDNNYVVLGADVIHPVFEDCVRIGNLRASYLKTVGLFSEGRPVYVHSTGSSVCITATELGGVVKIIPNPDLPDDFEIVIPSMMHIIANYSTIPRAMILEPNDSFPLTIINESTRTAHLSVLFASLNTFIPHTATNPSSIIPSGGFANLSIIADIVSPATSASSIIVTEISVPKGYIDSITAGDTMSHTQLQNIGVLTHSQIDASLSTSPQALSTAASPSFASVFVTDTTPVMSNNLASKNYVDVTRITSHTGLSDIGTLRHDEIDTSLGTSPQVLTTSG